MKSLSFFKKIIFFIAFTTICAQSTLAQDTLTNKKRYLYTHQNQLYSEIKVDSTLFNKGFVISFEELITGRIAGLQVTSNSGAPNSGFTIINRGSSNSEFNDKPLIVIDNVIVSSISIPINPNDIESIIMLKDAVDTAIFGELGAYGVLIISTKKGTKKLQVNYSGKVGIAELPKKVDVFSAQEFRSLVKSKFPNNSNLLGTGNMDWQDEIFRTSYSQDHHVSVSGSVLNIPLRASIGNTVQNGIVKTSHFNRTTAEFNANPSFFKKHLNIDLKLITNNNSEKRVYNSIFYEAATFDPTQPYYENSSNPINRLKWNNNSFNRDLFVGNILIDYKFHFFKDLRLFINYSSTEFNEDNSIIRSYYQGSGFSNLPQTGELSTDYILNDLYQKNKQYDFWLDYNKIFKNGKSSLNLKFGHSSLNMSTKSNKIEKYSFYPNNEDLRSHLWYDTNRYNLFSALHFNLLNKYDLKFTVNQDKNSYFGENAAYYPAFSLGWNIKNEFFKNSKTVSLLKFRLGYGSSGAGQKSSSFRLYHENITQFNSGLAFSFSKNRIWGNIDYYRRVNDKTIVFVANPVGVGFQNGDFYNNFTFENDGVEFSIGSKIISTNHWIWTVNTNTSINKNKVIDIDGIDNQTIIVSEISNTRSLNTTFGLRENAPLNSFYVFKQKYDTNGKPLEGLYEDINNDGVIDNKDMYLYKQSAPTTLIGISSVLNYKNWELSFGGRLSLGNYLYNSKNTSSNYFDIKPFANGFVLYNTTKSINETQFETPQMMSDLYVENASFFKMDYINLGYHIKDIFKSKISTYISGTVQNAFTITKYSGQDPESVTGIDGYSYPRPRIYSIGLKINY
jgi:TonB-dependent starch-binding outer membrane protein SusC